MHLSSNTNYIVVPVIPRPQKVELTLLSDPDSDLFRRFNLSFSGFALNDYVGLKLGQGQSGHLTFGQLI